MRKRTGKIILFTIAVYMFISSLIPQMTAFAAGVSVSSKSVIVGDTVTVTVKFSQSNIGAVDAKFSYDSSVLQYSGGSNTSGGGGSGKIILSAGAEGTSSLSASIKFKALKVGTSTVSVSATEILDMDMNSVGKASGSGKITVKEATVTTPKPSTSASAKPSASTSPATTPKVSATATPTTSPTTTPMPVTVNGTTLYIAQDLSAVQLPTDFIASQATYQAGTIPTAVSPDGKVTLAYLTEANGQNGAFYVLDTTTAKFYPYVRLTASGNYTVLQLPSSINIPQGYQQASLTLGSQTVTAWQQSQGQNPEFYLLYAMNPKGEAGFYLYDTLEGTIQRYADRSVALSNVAEPVVQQTLFQTIKGKPSMLLLFGTLLLLCIVLFVLLMLMGKKRRAQKDRHLLYDETGLENFEDQQDPKE